ncbi:MAG TPA: hypothetical protein VGU71_16205 [Candidatus Dormibacteraeota bacterium]|nr:hypothetical protein [Candidatus Dormibacteraeota bacterium]
MLAGLLLRTYGQTLFSNMDGGRFIGSQSRQLSKEHPRMSEDTLAIMVGTLVPFGLALLTLVDYSRSRDR